MITEKKKIILHSFFPDLWDKNSFDVYRMQRGVLVADEGDIIISAIPFDAAYLDYLRSLDILPKSVFFWHPHQPLVAPYNSFIESTELKNFFRSHVKTHYLDVFAPGYAEERLSEESGLEVFYNFQSARNLDDKSKFKNLLRALNLPVPAGREQLNSSEEIFKAVNELFLEGVENVIVKKNHGVSGRGNIRINKNFFASLGKVEKTLHIQNIFSYLGGWADTFLVEEFVPAISSPAIQYVCPASKNFNLISIHEQLFDVGSVISGYLFNESIFAGASFPWSQETDQNLYRELIEGGDLIMDVLIGQYNYFGYAGLDAVISHDKKVFFVDPNIRRMYGVYPFSVVKKIFKKQALPAFTCKNYLFYNNFVPGFYQLKELLKPLMFPINGKNEGAIILHFQPYKKHTNDAMIMFLGSDMDSVLSFENRFEVYIRRLLINTLLR